MTIDIDKDALLAAMMAGDVAAVRTMKKTVFSATKHIPLPSPSRPAPFNWARAAREMLEEEGVLQPKKKPARRRRKGAGS